MKERKSHGMKKKSRKCYVLYGWFFQDCKNEEGKRFFSLLFGVLRALHRDTNLIFLYLVKSDFNSDEYSST